MSLPSYPFLLLGHNCFHQGCANVTWILSICLAHSASRLSASAWIVASCRSASVRTASHSARRSSSRCRASVSHRCASSSRRRRASSRRCPSAVDRPIDRPEAYVSPVAKTAACGPAAQSFAVCGPFPSRGRAGSPSSPALPCLNLPWPAIGFFYNSKSSSTSTRSSVTRCKAASLVRKASQPAARAAASCRASGVRKR